MSKICQITGKKPMVGFTVSHSNKKTKRRFDINLLKKRFYLFRKKRWIKLKITAAGIKIINSIGIEKALLKINGEKRKNK